MKRRRQITLIKTWYEHVMRGIKPSETDLDVHFRGYADQAAVLVRRIENGQSWEDFMMGLDGAPAVLLQRLLKQVAALERSSNENYRYAADPRKVNGA